MVNPGRAGDRVPETPDRRWWDCSLWAANGQTRPCFLRVAAIAIAPVLLNVIRLTITSKPGTLASSNMHEERVSVNWPCTFSALERIQNSFRID
jgi:hypothetical protein